MVTEMQRWSELLQHSAQTSSLSSAPHVPVQDTNYGSDRRHATPFKAAI